MSFDGALIKDCTLPGKYSPIQNTLETLYSSLM